MDDLVTQKLRADLDEATKQHMPAMVVTTDYLRATLERIEYLEKRLEIVPGLSETADGISCRDETIKLQDARIQALETSLAEARRQALEEAAKACEAHMSQCLDDRDIQKRWSQIKARNAVYAQAIRALASGAST